ncbi:MAG: mechanosensitive ion channel family protein [Ignavibacteriae bacterium]|nr:mechanosensitive ion channel family protein [Ignavibacteriota bacterium]
MDWLQQIFFNPILYHTTIAVVIVVVFYLLSGVVKSILSWFGKKFFERTQTVLDDLILAVVRRNVRSLMVITGLHVALTEIRKGVALHEVTALQMLDYGDSILFIVAAVVLLRIVTGIVRVMIEWYLGRLAQGGSLHLKNTLGPLTSKVLNLLLGMIGVIIVLDHFGVNIGSLLVSLGVGSLAVALAAQDTLANMIAGFVILVDRPFSVGDRIELQTGQIGDVQQIGLRSTQLLNFDNNVIIIPNNELVKGRIVNYSYPAEPMRVLMRFELAHGTDAAKVRTLLSALAQQHPLVAQDFPPIIVLSGVTDVAMQFTFICRAISYTKQADVEAQIREQAYQAFQREGIQFAVPQRVIHMKANA